MGVRCDVGEERNLNGLERFLDAVDLVQPINFSLMLTVKGPPHLSFSVRQGSPATVYLRLYSFLIIAVPKSFFRRSPFLPRIECRLEWATGSNSQSQYQSQI